MPRCYEMKVSVRGEKKEKGRILRINCFTILRAVVSPWTFTPTARDPKLKPVVEAMPSRTMIANMMILKSKYMNIPEQKDVCMAYDMLARPLHNCHAK